MSSHHFPLGLRRFSLLVLGVGALAIPSPAATTSKPDTPPVTANANPASQSLLSRLPDPAQWEHSPLEQAVKDVDPIVKDATFQKMITAAFVRRDIRATVAALRELTTRYPNQYAPLHNLRGAIALHFKFMAEAENSFRRVTVIAPKSPSGWYNLSWVKLLQNRNQDAANAARQSVTVSPSFAPGWMALAACQDRLGKPAEATAAATHATQVAPHNAQPWILLAACKVKQKKPSDATSDLQHAREIDPNNAVINQLLGSCYLQTNDPARAIEPYEQSLKKTPNNALVCRQLGYCYLTTGRLADAIAVCRPGVKAQSTYAPGWDMLGLCYQRAGKPKDAVNAFEHAVKAAPADVNARTHLDAARAMSTAQRT